MENYIVSARKYRPSTFDTVVGQRALTTTLKNAIANHKLAHAYLFCGPRGVGKTTCARIFAKTINCLHPTAEGEACNECESCKAFNEQRSYNIHELDAASNNSVEDIRSLIEQVRIPPQIGKYKVYIIDEVHMLSQGAFNALLKTLEEPPAYVVFILATTEPQKLPATILSRCQRFDFGRIPAHQIIGRLRVALEEGHIQAEDAALSRIARAAEGGMRDAWSIMDMCLSYAQEEDGELTEALVLRVLGAADKSFLFAFADRLIDSDAAGALALIDEMMRKGREVQVFVRDVSAHLRALMLADICGEEQLSGLLEVTREDAAEYVAQAKRTSHTRLMRMLDLFLASETDMKWAAQPRFALETAALRACAPEESMQVEALVARVDELERKLREGVVAAAPARMRTAAAPEADVPDVAQGEAAPPPAKEAPKGPAPDAERIWQEAMRQAKQKPQLFGMLKFGRLVSGENGLFTVVYPKAMGAAYVKMLSIPEKNEEVAGYLTQAAGYPCTFRAAIEGTVQESDKAILSAQEEARKQAENSLNKVFDMFGRENVRVKDE